MLTLSLASLTGAVILGILSHMSRAVTGARYWAVGLFFISFAYGSYFFLQDMPHSIRATGHNLGLLIGHACWLIGSWKFVDKPLSSHYKIWLILPVVIATLFLTFVWPNRDLRIVIIGVWLIFARLSYIWILLRYAHNNKIEKLASNLAAFVAFAEVVFTVIYTVYGSLGHIPIIGSQISWIANMTWLGALLGITIGVPLLMFLSVGRLVEKLDFAAHHDSLTKLLNRRGFFARTYALISIAQRNKQSITVMMLDIDHFKRINDRHGHAVGDEVIETLAQKLHSILRDTDVVARWGGEEFCVLLHDATSEYAVTIANRIRESFSDTCKLNPYLDGVITLSAGIANQVIDEKKTFDHVQTNADTALYQAKKDGRNCVRTSD